MRGAVGRAHLPGEGCSEIGSQKEARVFRKRLSERGAHHALGGAAREVPACDRPTELRLGDELGAAALTGGAGVVGRRRLQAQAVHALAADDGGDDAACAGAAGVNSCRSQRPVLIPTMLSCRNQRGRATEPACA